MYVVTHWLLHIRFTLASTGFSHATIVSRGPSTNDDGSRLSLEANVSQLQLHDFVRGEGGGVSHGFPQYFECIFCFNLISKVDALKFFFNLKLSPVNIA